MRYILPSTAIHNVADLINALPGNAAVNMHPQQWETVFSVRSVQRSYLKNERRYEFSSEFSVEDSHGKFVVEED
jgi:hypothetical protein